MSLQERFENCARLLDQWPHLLEVEALKLYPNHQPGAVKQWCESLKKLSRAELWDFQTNFSLERVDSESLRELVQDIQELTKFEAAKVGKKELPPELLRKVSPKKKHEIDSLLSITDKFGEVDAILDIGGGVGHLSAALVYERPRKAFCVDFNEDLQKAGLARLRKWDQETLAKIKFIKSSFSEEFVCKEFEERENRMVVGLHSCGKLGTDVLKLASSNGCEYIALASCCYHKLEGAYNISKFAQTSGIGLSQNGLHLAARCYRYEDPTEFENKLMVRRYRYGLHLLNYERGQTEFASIGNTKLSDYQMSFFDYVKKYSDLSDLSRDEVERFYQNGDIQNKINDIILVDLIRAMFGRVIETYLVLDRALFLQERGYRVEIVEAFERKLSPRNLLLCCTLDVL